MATPSPSTVAASGSAEQLWAGSSNAPQVLFYNPDKTNTWYIGFTNSISVGAGNSFPLGPGMQITFSGNSTIYGAAAVGTAGLQVAPGASSFFQPTSLSNLGGISVFIQSTAPTGTIATNSIWLQTSGGVVVGFFTWSGSAWVQQQYNAYDLLSAGTIVAGLIAAGTVVAGIIDGTTVNAATFTGSTFQGSDFDLTTSGEFYYTGSPASGNLSVSIVPGSTTVTDAYGNVALAGVTVYLQSSGKQLAINISEPYGSGGLAVYLASSQAGPWTISSALLSFAVDLAGTDVNVSLEGNEVTFSSNGVLSTLTPFTAADSIILDSIAQPAQPGGAATLYASSGHEKYVSSSEGNAYNTGRLTSVLASPVTCGNTSSFTTITSVAVAALTYKVRGWMLIHGGANAGTGRLNLNGPSVTTAAIHWESITGTTSPVYNDVYATVLGNFATQTLSTTDPSQLVRVEGTVTFSGSGTLALRGQPVTSNTDTMIIDAGSYLEIEPVT
jgi:hypothetical protein